MTEKRKRGRPATGAHAWPRVTCRFSPDVFEVIQRIATAEGLTVTACVEKLALDNIADSHFIHLRRSGGDVIEWVAERVARRGRKLS